MLKELRLLLEATSDGASTDAFRHAIVEENVLLKPSAGTRKKTFRFLRDRFALDAKVPIFRVLRMLWDRDGAGSLWLAVPSR